MIGAVLFDWSNTLVQFTWDDDLLDAGHRAGFDALGRAGDLDDFTARYRDLVLDDAAAERDYSSLLRELLGELSDDDVGRFIDAEHEVWLPAQQPLASAEALLRSLHDRDVRTALVARAWPEPERVLRADVERFGFADLLDVQVYASPGTGETPRQTVFGRALDLLGVWSYDAIFVGDSLAELAGAAELGLTTIQALWFTADEAHGVEPDFMAFTPMDVLNVVARLNR